MKRSNTGVYSTVILGVVTGAVLLAACSEKQPAPEAVKQVSQGELVYNKSCKVCHAQGLNGAPILGNKKMWSKRAPQGIEVLVDHASNGFGLMPAKGGNAQLSDAEIQAAVEYMISKVQ